MSGRLIIAISAFLGLNACGDDSSASLDAAGDAAAPLEITADPPEAPGIAPCPDGWREVAGDPATCEPWPESGLAACDAHEHHLPGQPGCTPVGVACPADGMPADLPADRTVVFVREGAVGGDGTRAAPYGSMREFSFGGLRAGTIVALGRGTYDGAVRAPSGVSFWGACVAEVELRSGAPSTMEGVLTPLGTGHEIKNLQIGESERTGVWIGDSVDVVVEGVIIERARQGGIVVFGGALAARDVAIRDTRAQTSGIFGRGLNLELGATARLEQSTLVGNTEVAVGSALDGSLAELVAVAIRDTQPRTIDLTLGSAVHAQQTGAVTVTGSVLETSGDIAAFAIDAGSSVTLDRSVVRDTMPRFSDMRFGRGLGAERGATAEARRTLFERLLDVGILVLMEGSTVRLSDTVVREIEPSAADGTLGRAVSVQDAVFEATRLVVADVHEVAILASGAGATAAVADLAVRDMQLSNQFIGHGVHVGRGASATVERARVDRAFDGAIIVNETGSTLEARDLLVRDTGPRGDGRSGRAVGLQNGAVASVTDAVFERNREESVWVGELAALELERVVMRDTLERACAPDRCVEEPAGSAMFVVASGTATLRTFLVDRAPQCGLLVASGGELDATDGTVRGCAIGACVQIEGYDVDRLTRGVSYRENGVNLQATELPVPEPAMTVAER